MQGVIISNSDLIDIYIIDSYGLFSLFLPDVREGLRSRQLGVSQRKDVVLQENELPL